MEIVYIYIHDYRRFKKQNINFGSEYVFHYDERTNELNVEKNHLYINKFYNQNGHDNILNISAIIGENGTGKTSVLEYLIGILHDSSILANNDLILVKDQDKYSLISTKEVKINENTFEKSKLIVKNEISFSKFNYQTIFLSNIFNYELNFNNNLEIFNVSTDYLVNQYTNNKINSDVFSLFKNEEVKRQLKFLLDERNKKYFIFEFNKEIKIYLKDNRFISKYKDIKEFIFDSFLETLEKNCVFNKSVKYDFEYLKIIYLISLFSREIFILIGEKSLLVKSKDNDLKEKVDKKQDFFNEIKIDLSNKLADVEIITLDKLTSLVNYLFSKYQIFAEKSFSISLMSNAIFKDSYIKNLNLIKFIINELNILNVDVYEKTISIDFRNFKILDELVINSNTLIDHFRYDYTGISSGQRAFLNIFSRLNFLIYSEIMVNENKLKLESKKDIILMIDEGDLYLHPMWQKGLITHIIKFLNEIYHRFKIQIIFTANNPLPISDLLSYNTIFLSNDECNNKTIVKDSLEDQKQTFAANIHTLLADSFFVKGGLIGDFSKDKINEVIRLIDNGGNLNYEEHLYIKKLIKQIGEPLIKNKLLQMYTQNNGLDFLERLERVEKKLGLND